MTGFPIVPASPTRLVLRTVELFVFFFAVPGAFWLLRDHQVVPPVIPTLLVLTATAILLLRRYHPRTLRTALRLHLERAEFRRLGLLFLAGAILLIAYAGLVHSERFFDLPSKHPRVWLAVLVMYPLLSVIPQELVFRVYFFCRYRDLLPSRQSRILCSALLFGFAHVIYGNVIALLLSTVGGLLFAWTYERTRSLWLVSIEHACYGCLIFTIGLGTYFYSGPAFA